MVQLVSMMVGGGTEALRTQKRLNFVSGFHSRPRCKTYNQTKEASIIVSMPTTYITPFRVTLGLPLKNVFRVALGVSFLSLPRLEYHCCLCQGVVEHACTPS